MKNCPYCHTQVEDSTLFCTECGKPIGQALFCSKCGATLRSDEHFCTNCGNPVLKQELPHDNTIQTGSPSGSTTNYQPVDYGNQQAYYNETTYQGESSNGTKYAIITAIILLLLGGIGFYFYQDSQKRELERLEYMNQLELSKLQEKAKELQDQVEEANSQSARVSTGAVHAAEHRAVSAGGNKKKHVVVNGVGVRLRFAPSLEAGWLTWENGQTRSVPKYTKLNYTGWEDGDWYEVSYKGYTLYISKEYSYLDY